MNSTAPGRTRLGRCWNIHHCQEVIVIGAFVQSRRHRLAQPRTSICCGGWCALIVGVYRSSARDAMLTPGADRRLIGYTRGRFKWENAMGDLAIGGGRPDGVPLSQALLAGDNRGAFTIQYVRDVRPHLLLVVENNATGTTSASAGLSCTPSSW